LFFEGAIHFHNNNSASIEKTSFNQHSCTLKNQNQERVTNFSAGYKAVLFVFSMVFISIP
jgi:uncharacterized ion transporter superfamily protein YfcC